MAENRRRRSGANRGKESPSHKEIKFQDDSAEEDDLEADSGRRSSGIRVASLVLRLCIFLVLLVIACLIYRAWTPQNMNKVSGYALPDRENGYVQDIPGLLSRAQEANYPLFLTERDINLYLSRVVKGKQGGPIGVLARYEGVAVRLYDGYAEIILVRTMGNGYRQTVSMYVSPSSQETLNGPVVVTEYSGPDLLGALPVGGRIGKLPVPQGYLHFIRPAFISLAEALKPELELLLDPHRPIQIRPGEMQILPSRSSDMQGG